MNNHISYINKLFIVLFDIKIIFFTFFGHHWLLFFIGLCRTIYILRAFFFYNHFFF